MASTAHRPPRHRTVTVTVKDFAENYANHYVTSQEGADSNSNMPGTICITGGTQGVGYQAALQLASRTEYDKIIISSRSERSAKAAIAELMKATGQPESKFGFILMDLLDRESCINAAKGLPSNLGGIILNAGQGRDDVKEVNPDSGLNFIWQETVLGHSYMLTQLLEDKKFAANARIIYSGSEVTRPIMYFTGIRPDTPYVLEHIKDYPANPVFSCGPRSFMNVYGQAKMFMTLFIKKLAVENPDLYFSTVSPGGVVTGFYQKAPAVLKCMVSNLECVMKCMHAMHDLDTAAKRYVDSVCQLDFPTRFPSGSVLASPNSFPYWGAAGELTDNGPFNPVFTNQPMIDETARVIREEMQRVGSTQIVLHP